MFGFVVGIVFGCGVEDGSVSIKGILGILSQQFIADCFRDFLYLKLDLEDYCKFTV